MKVPKGELFSANLPPDDGRPRSRCCKAPYIQVHVFMVFADGRAEPIGTVDHCSGKRHYNESWHPCGHIYNLHKWDNWPADLNGTTWKSIASKGLGPYWRTQYGLYVARLSDGKFVNMAELNWVPPYTDPQAIIQEIREILVFRAKHEETLDGRVRQDFGAKI